MKIKIVFDSSVGLTKKEIEKLGAGFVPLVISIDGKEYQDGIDLDHNELAKLLTPDVKCSTAAATLGDLEKVFRENIKGKNHIVYISLTKHLSSSNNNANIVSNEEEFKGKVTVVDSLWITPWTYLAAESIINKAKEGDLDSLISYIMDLQSDVTGFIIPENMQYLKNGGRVSKSQYILGSLAKINPIIPVAKGAINDEVHKIKTLKGKGVLGAAKKAMSALMKDWKKYNDPSSNYYFAFSARGEYRDEFIKYVKSEAIKNGYDEDKMKETILCGAIVVHTGPSVYLGALIKEN